MFTIAINHQILQFSVVVKAGRHRALMGVGSRDLAVIQGFGYY